MCRHTTQLAGTSDSELGDGLRPVVDADAFRFVPAGPNPGQGAVGVLGGAQVFKVSCQIHSKFETLKLVAPRWGKWVDGHLVWPSECENQSG